MNSALTEIEKLVLTITKDALNKEGKDIPFHDKVEALKVLTPYFVALRKDRDDIVTSTGTMAEFAHAMKESDNGAIRSGRRNGRRSARSESAQFDTERDAGHDPTRDQDAS
jgi:hypothetical protein